MEAKELHCSQWLVARWASGNYLAATSSLIQNLTGVAGAADSAGPGRRQGLASDSDGAATAADCQVCRWKWARPAHTTGMVVIITHLVACITFTKPSPQIISHAVLAKPGAPGQTVQARVLPVSGVAARQGQQTIQVLFALLLISPFSSLSIHHHLHPTSYGIAKRNCSSPLLSYPGSSSSTRHSTRKLAQRLPRPAWPTSGERPCQRPSRRQPRQDPGPHGENLWKAHHIDYKSTIRVHHNSRSSHKCPLHLLPTAKTSQWPSERPSLALPPCKALASSGVSTTRRLLRAQQRQQQGSKWSTFN